MLNDIDRQSLDKVSAQIGKDKSRTVVGDISKEETARRLAEEAMSAFGLIDVLVNNAGIHFLKDVTDMSVGRNPQEVLRVLDALQTDELCPCNWQKGEETLKAA